MREVTCLRIFIIPCQTAPAYLAGSLKFLFKPNHTQYSLTCNLFAVKF